jgi:hypothetical protein
VDSTVFKDKKKFRYRSILHSIVYRMFMLAKAY